MKVQLFSHRTSQSYRQARRDRYLIGAIALITFLTVLISSVLAMTSAASAAEVQNDGLYLRPMGQSEAPFASAPRLAQSVQLDIAAIVARGTVIQLFRNDSTDWVEGRYRFPLPDKAAVDRLTIRVNDRVVEGEIRERSSAKKEYDAAKAAGQTAALLDENRPNQFMLSLANIGPGEMISVTLEFQSTVDRDGDLFEFRMPLVTAPRYIPDMKLSALEIPQVKAEIDRQMADAARLGFPIDEQRQSNPTGLQVTLDAGAELATLESPSHDLVVTREGEKYKIGLRLEAEPADRDIVLRWRTQSNDMPGAMLFHERIGAVDYLLAMIQPPRSDQAKQLERPRDVTFVIDTSGSMEGESMKAASAALIQALAALGPKDRFDVIEFDSSFQRLFGQTEPATPARIQKAIGFVAGLKADGGTEMMPPLRSALASGHAVEGSTDQTALRQIVFLTDGLVGNEDELFQMIEANLGNARLFTVSLGSAPNGWFMRKSAQLGAGETLNIANVSEAAPKMAEFYKRIETPVAIDLDVTADPATRMEVYPDRLPDLYGARALIVPIAMENWGGDLTFTGKMAQDDMAVHLTRADLRPAKGIAKLWARTKVESIEDDIRRGAIGPEEGRLAVLDIALPHRLATAYTSFVAVDRPVRRPESEDLRQRDMPNNLPAGMVMASLAGPAGATGWQGMILIGVGLIAGSIVLLLISRRRGFGARK
ncbi:marine proteobacterial sortase target protein [Hwanghaeella sp. 1Z406]|jgi:Ca-activated chloride channel family protein|uniref:marine proteobacterial sortase target protein n=1 Tax=Hwanghaeella sp. 1Z406 TaxID=3402811 RepID=UPI00268ED16C|tara:strand:+ start:24698 stop:26824 length:2127 start_codon:yes stop_codon:yes gene_type:complete